MENKNFYKNRAKAKVFITVTYIYFIFHKTKLRYSYYFKGNSHQILLSETSLPGIEAFIKKLLLKVLLLGRLGKENPSKRHSAVMLYKGNFA